MQVLTALKGLNLVCTVATIVLLVRMYWLRQVRMFSCRDFVCLAFMQLLTDPCPASCRLFRAQTLDMLLQHLHQRKADYPVPLSSVTTNFTCVPVCAHMQWLCTGGGIGARAKGRGGVGAGQGGLQW